MDDLTLYIAIFATLAVLLCGLLFLKSKTSNEEEKKPAARRRAAVPNRDEDGQIINTGPRGRRGGGPRMRRRYI